MARRRATDYVSPMKFDLDRAYSINPEQIDFFRRNGFVRLKHVFTAQELDHYGAELTRLTLALNKQTRPLEERSTYGKAFLQITNLWEHGGLAREFVFGKRLAGIAATLLEVEGVRLYHDQSLMKEPGGGFTPAHADQYYWPLATDRSITAWVPLQAVPAEMGPVGFYAGSHKFEFGRDLAISDESERLVTEQMEAQEFPLANDPFELGEVSFHQGWTFHRADPNLTDRPRSVMTIIYMDRDMRLKAPSNRNQQIDWDVWCPDATIGEIIDTPKNPVLYER
jgi:ectoine hydroxylase-related dioxygenase (phytanoyl-CoA dioxygenase family)